MQNLYSVSYYGEKCNIISFEALRHNEPGDIISDTHCLDRHQYLSMLFGNLGYNRCPKDLSWIEKGIDITEVEKTEVLDYPITRHRLMLCSGSVTLYHLLIVIANWIHCGIEKGHIVDPYKSSVLPNSMETQFSLENNLKVKRRCNIRNKIDLWDKSNIFMRRQYNLSPYVDPDYFDNSIIDFEAWSKVIRVDNPSDIFKCCMINPDVFFSIIRESERLAYKNALETSSNTFRGIPDDKSVVERFIPIFKSKCAQIGRILEAKSPVIFKNRINNNDIKQINPVIYDSMLDQQEVLIDAIKTEINNTVLDGDHKSYIVQYIDPYSLQIIDSMPEDDQLRIATYKRLYYTLSQIKANNPELLNRKEKFTFSKSFYINHEVFALYNKYRRKFFVTTPELVMYEMTPEEIVEYYKAKYNMQVSLDPEEMGDSFMSARAPDINLDELEKPEEDRRQLIAITLTPKIPEFSFNPEIYDPEDTKIGLDLSKYIEN